MKKGMKTALLTTAVSALCAVSAFAADGWKTENNQWVYYQNDTKLYNTWVKGADMQWYYLGSDGYMATNSIVDGGMYAVDDEGKMIKDSWRQVNSVWYYYGSDGKSVENKARQINGQWYYFGGDGMLTGWIEDDDGHYYFYDPEKGNRYTNIWVKTTPPPGTPDDDMSGPEYDGEFWYYFGSNGRMYRATDEEYKEYTINGYRYAFDEFGRLRTGWVKLKDTDPVIAGYKYYNDVASLGSFGAAHTGWLSTYGPEDEAGFSGDMEWFYFDSKGTPYYGSDVSDQSDDETLVAKLKILESNGTKHKYLFDEYGNPVYGLRKVKRTNGDITSMYFGTKDESCLQLGDKNVTDADGETSTFYFDGSGYGYTGVKNGKLYYMGKLQKAVDDSYAYYTVKDKTYLVNKSGNIKKNYNKNRDDDEVEYKSDANGYRSGGTADESELIVPAFEISEY